MALRRGWPCWLLGAWLSLSQLGFTSRAVRGVSPPARRTARPANLADAVAEANAAAEIDAREWPPKGWLRLSTTVSSEEGKQKVIRAIMAISEGLRLEESPVRWLRRGTGAEATRLALWVPPRSMLLVSSMMGEALEDEMPMILVEGLDVDGDAQFFRGALTGATSEELTSTTERLLEARLCAAVEVEEAAGTAVLHTTAAGRKGVEAWLKEEGGSLSIDWTALGGNSEYLSWVEAETAQDAP
ncbi:adck1 [Symbiodinium natans]|uniref:Adck1 protein n=1 Tax=Symbiodinium natans TaxID=878477 RepID=A0A812GWL5_9DINO|nr:adck1 [Symbiodinium natans]